jgi:hypothetical protein
MYGGPARGPARRRARQEEVPLNLPARESFRAEEGVRSLDMFRRWFIGIAQRIQHVAVDPSQGATAS